MNEPRSHFITKLVVEQISDTEWRLIEPLAYFSERLDRQITVPKGFVTDFASVPRLPFAYMIFGNIAQEEAVIHDYLYHKSGVSREDADAVFDEAMQVKGKWWWRRKLMWSGLRLFGWQFYEEEDSKCELL